MNLRSRFGLLAVCLIILNIAAILWIRHEMLGRGRPAVRVLSALPSQEVDAADRLSLLFDEPIGIGAKAGVEPAIFSIEPQPKGHWDWPQPNRLDFVLDEPLPPGRTFVIRPIQNFETWTGWVLIGQREYRFATRPLELESCLTGTADREDVTIELTFNQPVAPADLLHHLELRDPVASRSLEATCLTLRAAIKLFVRCARPVKEKLQVRLAGELAGAGAERSLGEPIVCDLTLPLTFCLLRADAEQPYLEPTATVNLVFSQCLDAHQAIPTVEVTPPVKGMQTQMVSSYLVLEGPFESNRKYTVTVGPEVKSDNDERLGKRQALDFEVPDRQTGLAFPLSYGLLMPTGQLQLDLKAVNVSSVTFTACRLYANNLVAHVRGQEPDDTSRQLFEKTIALSLPRNKVSTMAVDLRELLGKGAIGVYSLSAKTNSSHWADDQALVTISNLAITTKKERDGVLVWVTSVQTGRPLPDVQVAVLTRTNQTLATDTTDAEGLVHLTIADEHPDGAAWLITAQAGDDLNYLQPAEHTWVLDHVDHAGKAYPRTYDVMLYTERGIYRPGETIHVTGLIRDGQGNIPEPFPLSVTVKRPDGKKVQETVVTAKADEQGFFHADVQTTEDGQLGRYEIVAHLPGAKELLGQTSALVEEYVPVRIDVKAEPTQARFAAQESPKVQVSANYLFGQPGAKLPLRMTAIYKRVSFESARFAKYTFKDPHQGDQVEIEDIEQTLDEQGQATVEVPLARPASSEAGSGNSDDAGDPKVSGCWAAKVTATVSEPGGRSVSARSRLIVDTAAHHTGLRGPSSKIVPVDQPVSIEWVQVTGEDELATPTGLTWTLSRVGFDTTLERVDNRYVWQSKERLTEVSKGEISPGETRASGSFDITCSVAGLYRLVAAGNSSSDTQIEFRADSEIGTNQTMAMDDPERLDVLLDQAKYVPGSQAKVVVQGPFAGTLLLTLESDRVLWHQIVQMQANTVSLDLPIPQDLRGGAFLAASIVRAVDPAKDTWLPHRAAGLARVVVDHQDRALPVTIETVPTAQPGEKINVLVRIPVLQDAPKSAYVHLWAVDEGILKTIGFKTPNPQDYFLSPHAASVDSGDSFGLLLPDYKRPASMIRIGGDDDGGRSVRRSLVPSRRREAAVIWRTVAPIADDGTATVEMPLPDLTGQIRLMAVAAQQDRYGTTQQDVTVTSPLLVEASWPRFAAPGDAFDVPVKVFNATDQPLEVTLAASLVEGPIEIHMPAEPTFSVAAQQPTTVWLRATATGMGQVRVELQAAAMQEGDGLKAIARADLPIRPAAAMDRQVRLLRVKAGETVRIAVPESFIRDTVCATVSIGARPTVQMQPALEQLIEYPYGCLEQTTSQLVALLYAPDLLARADSQDNRATQIGRMIDAGIARLWSMQTVSGGLGYWPGDRYANLWGSAHAAGFLLRAKQSGYRVEPQLADPLIAYLAGRMHKVDEPMDPNMRAMLCSVLAGFGKVQQGWVDRLAERLDELDLAGRADLADAFLSAGQRDRAIAVLRDDIIEQAIVTTSSDRLTSQVQQQARLLHVLLDLDPEHPWIARLVQVLQGAGTDGHWSSTLENGAALSALARYQLLNKDIADFTGSLLCQNEERMTFTSTAPASARLKNFGDSLEIRSTGTGDVYVSVLFEGLAQQGQAAPYDHQLTVRRNWLDHSGEPIEPANLKVGDLVRVEIELTAPGLKENEEVDNLAIVDALSGGLEIENPRLVTSAEEGFAVHSSQPDRVEFRDDRVVLFASAGRQPRIFRYSLRVITAGTFVIPPIEASCMYKPQFASLSGAGKAEVHR